MAQLYLILATLLTVPGIWLKLSHGHISPGLDAFVYGVAILGAAFLISWAAEVAQKDISQALAVAILALIAVLPEYAVDFSFAWEAARRPEFSHYALANMTGANRLLVGVGWPAVVLLFALRFKKVGVKLESAHRVEIFYMGLATCYAVVLPLKKTLSLWDAVFFLAIFAMYTIRISRAQVHEPELIGPAKLVGDLPAGTRRLVACLMFLFSGTVIFMSAHPFAHSLVEAGKNYGIDEFLLVQWLAPLASEAPEFIVALIWTFRGDAPAGLGALVSSKVNQWTLLVGTLPIVYSISLGRVGAMQLDLTQQHEVWLTAAQSLLAVAILSNLSLSWYGALILFALFASQLVYDQLRMPISYVYVALSLLLMLRDRRHYAPLFRTAIKG